MNNLRLTQNNVFLSRNNRSLASASTFSKVQLFGAGKTPFCLEKGEGAYTWDVDGNKYIDYIIGLGCMTLGHNHPVVNDAIINQLNNGISFSLPTPVEIEVAEMLIERVPSAEMARFGKNGSDVTSAAVRVARYYTGKDHILFCGYHGWQEWYISQTSKKGGIPKHVGETSHRFTYNDIDSISSLIRQYKDNVACIIMEPVSKEWPVDNFLEKVRDIATKNNIILIFDEIVTGFRFHKAGIQVLLDVEPDMSCFSKAIANGMPLSVLLGRPDIMSKFNGDIFFSLTNAGETLSLAAAKAVIKFYDEVDVISHIARNGKKLKDGLEHLIVRHGLFDRMKIIGFDCRFGIAFINKDIQGYDSTDDLVYWTKLVTSHGILSGGWHMISYAHTDDIIEETLQRYDNILPVMKERLVAGHER